VTTLKLTRPSSPARTGVWIGIAAITMSFAAYTSALVVRQGATPDWQHFRLPPILYLNTLLLLASSGTLERGRGLMRKEARWRTASTSRGPAWLLLTLVLGLLFIVGQVVAWRDLAAQGLFLNTNPSSSFFYVFTALHALHLLGGVTALGYVLARLYASVAGPGLGALDATSLYWHFMDVLWLYLLAVLALWF
jgi:cytochrome c oxidase subunit III